MFPNQKFEKEAYIRDAYSTVISNYEKSLKKKTKIPKITGGIWDCDDMDSSEESDDLETPAREQAEICRKHVEEKQHALTENQLFSYEEYLEPNEDTLDNDSAECDRNEISKSSLVARKRNLSSESSKGSEATCVPLAMDCDSEATPSYVKGLSTSFVNLVPAIHPLFAGQNKHFYDNADSNKLDEKLIKPKDNPKEANKRLKLHSETTLFPDVANKATFERGNTKQSLDNCFLNIDQNFTQIKNATAVSGSVEHTNDTSFVTAPEEPSLDMPVTKSKLPCAFPMLQINPEISDASKVENVPAYDEEIEDLKKVTALFVSLKEQPELPKSSFTSAIESLKKICLVLEGFEAHAKSHIQVNDIDLGLPKSHIQVNDIDLGLPNWALPKLEEKNENEAKLVVGKDCVETVSTSVGVVESTHNVSYNFSAAMSEGLIHSKDECLVAAKDSNMDMAFTDQQMVSFKQTMDVKELANDKETVENQMLEDKEIVVYPKKVPKTQLQVEERPDKTLNVRNNSAFKQVNTVQRFKARNIPPRMLNQYQPTTTDTSWIRSKPAFTPISENFDNTPSSSSTYKYTNNRRKPSNQTFTSNKFQERKEPTNHNVSPDMKHEKPWQNQENRYQPDLSGWRSPNHVPEWRPPNKSMQQNIDDSMKNSNSSKFKNSSDDMMNVKVFEMGGRGIDELLILYDAVAPIRKRFPRFSELVPYPDMTAKRLEWSAQSMVVILRFIFSISYTLPSWEIALEVYTIAKNYKFVKLQESCLEYFNSQPITVGEAQKIVQLAHFLKVVDVLRSLKMFAKVNFAHETAVPISFPNQSCSVVCAIYAEPSDFTIPLVSQKKSMVMFDLGSTKQCDLTNELVMETNADICFITGIQIKLEADICDLGKELRIFYDVFRNEKKIFGNEREKKLQKLMIINFESLTLKRTEKMKISVLIEDICLRLCYLTLENQVKNDDFRLTLRSDKKSTHDSSPLFFVEKVFYTVQGNA